MGKKILMSLVLMILVCGMILISAEVPSSGGGGGGSGSPINYTNISSPSSGGGGGGSSQNQSTEDDYSNTSGGTGGAGGIYTESSRYCEIDKVSCIVTLRKNSVLTEDLGRGEYSFLFESIQDYSNAVILVNGNRVTLKSYGEAFFENIKIEDIRIYPLNDDSRSYIEFRIRNFENNTAPSGSGGGGSGATNNTLPSNSSSGGGSSGGSSNNTSPSGSGGGGSSSQCSTGCNLNGSCVSFGYRINNTFCDLNKSFVPQKQANEICENDFECSTNLCIDNKCVSGNVWQKFLKWISRLFG